jgi:hypothetical protein
MNGWMTDGNIISTGIHFPLPYRLSERERERERDDSPQSRLVDCSELNHLSVGQCCFSQCKRTDSVVSDEDRISTLSVSVSLSVSLSLYLSIYLSLASLEQQKGVEHILNWILIVPRAK